MNQHTQTYNMYYAPEFRLDNVILTLEKKLKTLAKGGAGARTLWEQPRMYQYQTQSLLLTHPISDFDPMNQRTQTMKQLSQTQNLLYIL